MAASEMTVTTRIKMQSGYEIPVLGFGVYQTPAAITEDVVSHAFKTGYRHIDSARAYRNEQPCAIAMKASLIPRNEVFFTSKVPPRAMSYESAKAAIASTLEQTGFDYIDLFLIHSPYGGATARKGTWRALVEAQRAGLIRSIGVSNYGVHHLNELEDYIAEMEATDGAGKGGVISVGQYELHPWLTRPDIVGWCRERDIVIEAYSPLVRGQRFEEEGLKRIAERHGRTPAQVLLRWSLQKGFVPLPKSVTMGRIEENVDIFGFELSEDDMGELETEEYSPCTWDPTVSRD